MGYKGKGGDCMREGGYKVVKLDEKGWIKEELEVEGEEKDRGLYLYGVREDFIEDGKVNLVVYVGGRMFIEKVKVEKREDSIWISWDEIERIL